MDWRTTLATSTEQPDLALKAEQPDPAPSAEQRFRAAFERLKLGVPTVLPKGTRVSQNNVAKEAGCDSSALRRTRFPLLVIAIQEWVEANKGEQETSERQRRLKQRRKNRDKRETIADLTKERDFMGGLLADGDLRILELTAKVADLEAKLDNLQPSARIIEL